MTLHTSDTCPSCGVGLKYEVDGKIYSRVIGVEYASGPNRYDGISEWQCPDCHYRVGRWTGNVLAEGEEEPRFGGQP